MAKQKDLLQLVTANRLLDGLVVYFDDQLRWSENINDAQLVRSKEEADDFLEKGRAAVAHDVVEPYLIDVEIENGSIVPVRYREKLRILGPSVRLDLGRQAKNNSNHLGNHLGSVHV